MAIRDEYIESMTEVICKADPSLKYEDVQSYVKKMWKEYVKNPTIIMDNNVTGKTVTTKLTSLCDWISSNNPVISGNGTFYKQPSQYVSPTSGMLRYLKQRRKAVKKEMFLAKKAGNDDLYRQLDLEQLNIKIVMNAEYGGSGAPTAAFYTKYSPAATTLMAQSIITTMAAFFEGYVGDNHKFYHIDECIDWLETVRQKSDPIHKWMKIPDVSTVQNHIKMHFPMYDKNYDIIIDNYISNCSSDELVYIYYANNLKAVIRDHTKIQKYIKNIFTDLPRYEASTSGVPGEYKSKFKSEDDYNGWVSNEMFLNPYSIPECISNDMTEVTEILNKYVYVEYTTPDSIVKLNNHIRNTILLVDTDSNVINADIFVQFLFNEIFPGESFGRGQLYNDMIAVNFLASVLDDGVMKLLDFYGRCRNMDDDARKELTMKNEFMFRILFLMEKKKRYAASIALREGVMMAKLKTEIKGMEFIKAGVSDEVTKTFTTMLEDKVLSQTEPDLHGLMYDLKTFEKNILHDLRTGGTKYYKLARLKPEAGYKKATIGVDGKEKGGAWAQQPFKAAAMWNVLYPLNKIYSMDRMKIIKLTITDELDLERIKDKYPEDYKLIKEKIFRSMDPHISSIKLKLIAVPANMKTIPDWIIEFIDYDITVSDLTGSFRSILDSLSIEVIRVKTPNGKANVVSSLISI